jgi:hypothetical protein
MCHSCLVRRRCRFGIVLCRGAVSWYGGGHLTSCIMVNRYLNLQGNALSGSFPSSLSNLAALTCVAHPAVLEYGRGVIFLVFACCSGLYLHVNQLSGSIPSVLGAMASLR